MHETLKLLMGLSACQLIETPCARGSTGLVQTYIKSSGPTTSTKSMRLGSSQTGTGSPQKPVVGGLRQDAFILDSRTVDMSSQATMKLATGQNTNDDEA